MSAAPRGSRLSPKRLLFALVTLTAAAVVSGAAILAVDIYLHYRFERSAIVNVWGYRGPVVGRKRPGERRVAVLGGSAAFGYGVTWDEAFPAVLERELIARSGPSSFSVVNLGYNNEGAYSLKPTLEDYLWLGYDIVFLYEGYNDLTGDPRAPNVSVFRHESPIFRLTGYLPIFPIVFKEKAAAMLNGGDVNALYRDSSKTVFRPGLATRATADVLEAAATVGQSLERQIARLSVEPRHEITDVASTGCKYPWQEYCRSVLVAAEFALQHGKQVLVGTQPYEVLAPNIRLRHIEQQRELAGMIERRFGADARVRYLNFGELVDLRDPRLSFDGMHLTPAGNERLGSALVEPVVEMTAVASGSPPGDQRR